MSVLAPPACRRRESYRMHPPAAAVTEADTAAEYTVRFSCLEIYNDNIYDLLSTLPSDGHERRELSLAEHRGKVEIKGLLQGDQ